MRIQRPDSLALTMASSCSRRATRRTPARLPRARVRDGEACLLSVPPTYAPLEERRHCSSGPRTLPF